MSLKITDECINCDVCEPVCPNEAIYMGDSIYEINPKLCTECVGHHDEPQCMVFCPVECIETGIKESQSILSKRYQDLSEQG